MSTEHFATEAWELLGEDPADPLIRPTIEPRPHLPSPLDVAGLVAGSVTTAAAQVHRVMVDRGLRHAAPPVVLDGSRLTTSVRSDRHFRLDGEPVDAWAPLSGFWQTADGWVRTHGNYPHHAARLRQILDIAEDADRGDVATAIRLRGAHELEEAAATAGAILVAVRSPEQWQAHPQAESVAAQPLLSIERVSDAPARPWNNGRLPLEGIRVLDLTRVIAGPVATRDLAFAGADVLRVDSPRLPEIEWQHLDTGQGKRSTRVDLTADADRTALETLLSTADVVVTGYRPHSLDRFGLTPANLVERHPGLVVASVSAWGAEGPWAERRGFDSIVQAASGIAVIESKDGSTPGAMPAQALDHSAGHFLAAAIIASLRRQRREGGSWAASISLARVAHALLRAPRADPATEASQEPAPALQIASTSLGEMTVAAPILTYDGARSSYPELAHRWGGDQPRWTSGS